MSNPGDIYINYFRLNCIHQRFNITRSRKVLDLEQGSFHKLIILNDQLLLCYNRSF